ncbi:hypothetical protein DB30_00673 [Enhygromyxa salina]|uniref:Uncharacterized protein n=1 Tax=Enhygromyxa salina TaxID=215803 RepID=A0A0C2A4R6_9BACT|nr:hypothetical protein [Enhygromyxa salina]KIG18388.1 hypothetical protein DB30_00673 [Enhygromyxa salina]
MFHVALALLCLLGTAGCLGLAYLVFRHQHPGLRSSERRTLAAPESRSPWVGVEVEPTSHVSREEIFAAAHQRSLAQRLSTAGAAPREHARSRPVAFAGGELPVRETLLARPQLPSPQLPSRAPDPERPAEAPLPAAPQISPTTRLAIDGLRIQLDVAQRLFARWLRERDTLTLEHLAKGPEQLLLETLADMATTCDEAIAAVLEPALTRDERGGLCHEVAALALLQRDETHALRLIDRVLGGPAAALAPHQALSLWRGRQVDGWLCERARADADNRGYWLTLLDSRRLDPGSELLRELLAEDDPKLLVRGLELARYHGDPELRRSAAAPHLVDTRDRPRHLAAVELALFDRESSAWGRCRQLANAHGCPRATELVASLGSASDLAALMQRPTNAEGEGLWRLCRSGRKAAAALAARRLQDTRGDKLAASALSYVIGRPPNGAKTAEALLNHWVRLAPTLSGDRRYLHGELFGGTNGLRSCLSSLHDRHHQALGEELFYRSKGMIRWPGRGFARDTLADIRAVGTPNIDFETSFEQ